MAQSVDQARYRESMARLYEIFRGMSDTTTEISARRCPYKNVQDRCTAKFGCRNQGFFGAAGDLPNCTGSDDLDYREAWQV